MLEPVIPIIKDSLKSEDQTNFYNIGAEAIRKGKLAVCTLAGGQGSRLGHKGPKGTLTVIVLSESIFISTPAGTVIGCFPILDIIYFGQVCAKAHLSRKPFPGR